jgi:hypothetical protein
VIVAPVSFPAPASRRARNRSDLCDLRDPWSRETREPRAGH